MAPIPHAATVQDGRNRALDQEILIDVANTREPWWANYLQSLTPAFFAYVMPRTGGDEALAEDVVREAVLSITDQLSTRPATYPTSWFELLPPPEEDMHAFTALAWQILRRRFRDALRRRYVRNRPLPASGEASSTDLEATYVARSVLRHLAAILDDLPNEDRALLMDAAAGDRAPMSAAERVRLMRLRNRISAQLADELGLGGNP